MFLTLLVQTFYSKRINLSGDARRSANFICSTAFKIAIAIENIGTSFAFADQKSSIAILTKSHQTAPTQIVAMMPRCNRILFHVVLLQFHIFFILKYYILVV